MRYTICMVLELVFGNWYLGGNGMIEWVSKKEYYVDFKKAERNFFREATKASEFILSQLNSVSEEEMNTECFNWAGEECLVPASTLNTVLRSLEALGVQDLVAIFPAINEPVSKKYIIKPFIIKSDCIFDLGIAVNVQEVKRGSEQDGLASAKDVINIPDSVQIDPKRAFGH